jgi:hypothetical protein
MTGARRALVVASDAYDAEGLRDLRSPRADATALAAVLGDPQIGDFAVEVVHNEPSHVVQARVEELFAEARPDDLVLLHVACHGLKNETGELFFAARNTRLGRLESTAVPADFVQRCMRASRSRSIVLLLDCCYGGAFGSGVSVRAAGPVDVVGSFPAGRLGGGRGRAVITASSAMEYAFEGTTLADDSSAPSVFTEALVRGLTTGEADRDEDGWVSLNELYEYVFDEVRTSTPGQTPTRDVEMQGELYLARSRRRRVQPGPLPPDLLAASHDSNVFTRLGAVSELRARLLGDNLSAAAGAHQRLIEMAEQDISYVATAAAAAIADGVFGCDPLEIAFGQVVQGTSSPALRVTTTGPPLARTCVIETSDPRIRVLEDSGDLVVSVDTSSTGHLTGAVTLRSPFGQQVVRVTADVAPTALAPAPAPGPVPVAPAAPGRGDDRAPAPRSPVGEAVHVPEAPPGVEAPRGVEPPRRRAAHRRSGPPGRPGGWPHARRSGPAGHRGWAPFRHGSPLLVMDPTWFWQSMLLAALLAVAGAMALGGPWRWPAGAGLVLGAGVASTWGLVALATAWAVDYRQDGGLGAGFWSTWVGHVVVLLGAVMVALRVLPDAGGSVGKPELPRSVVLVLAAAGALAGTLMAVAAGRTYDGGTMYWVIPAWMAVTAAAAPIVVAFVRPGPLRVWLLVGWLLGAGVGVTGYLQFLELQGAVEAARPTTWAAVAMLVPLAVVLARTERPPDASQVRSSVEHAG